ncbi:MAG: 50S ribosomal protein L32 [Planctomycetaceae bacterium]|nr:50S ribosomal protein L32 [Planctomycetaceae bacterium]
MAIPKRRQSKTRSRKRRSHDAVKPLKLQYCSECGQAKPSHTACPTCGHYMGRTVVKIND